MKREPASKNSVDSNSAAGHIICILKSSAILVSAVYLLILISH